MAGRPRKPTYLKVLEGNPGKRALPKAEPKPKSGIPTLPRHLSPEAKKEWRRICKELITLGVLTTVDRAALAAYCQSWARWVEAETQMAAPGFKMLETTDKGYVHVSPWFYVADKAQKQMKMFLVEFGLTPASRSKVTIAQPEAADPYNEFLARRKAG